MAWSISYLPPKEPDLLDDFFLAVGKALYLATSFEAKCRSVLLFTRLVDHIEQEHNLDAALTLTNQMKARMLGGTIRELKGSPHFAGANLEAVDKGRESRNFIAHEAADLGYPLCYASSDNIAKRLAKLRVAVSVLAAGDNVVSRWLYEIEEKHPAGNAINPKNAVRDTGTEFHPGAIRYYKEIGIWPEDASSGSTVEDDSGGDADAAATETPNGEQS